MSKDNLLEEIRQLVNIHDSNLGIDILFDKDNNLELEVKLYQIDKFMGLSELANLIKKVTNKYDINIKSIGLKKNKETDKQIKLYLK